MPRGVLNGFMDFWPRRVFAAPKWALEIHANEVSESTPFLIHPFAVRQGTRRCGGWKSNTSIDTCWPGVWALTERQLANAGQPTTLAVFTLVALQSPAPGDTVKHCWVTWYSDPKQSLVLLRLFPSHQRLSQPSEPLGCRKRGYCEAMTRMWAIMPPSWCSPMWQW